MGHPVLTLIFGGLGIFGGVLSIYITRRKQKRAEAKRNGR